MDKTRKQIIEAKIKSVLDIQAYVDDELTRLNNILNEIKIEENFEKNKTNDLNGDWA